MENWFINRILSRMASGHLGTSLDDDAPKIKNGPISTERMVLEGICSSDGVDYWSFDGVFEFWPHGLIRMIGIRAEHASDGEALSARAYNREYHTP